MPCRRMARTSASPLLYAVTATSFWSASVVDAVTCAVAIQRAMRERMRAELSKSPPGEFDLKRDAGGITDIEFLVQYLQLRHGGARPSLRTSGTLTALTALGAEGILPATDVATTHTRLVPTAVSAVSC